MSSGSFPDGADTLTIGGDWNFPADVRYVIVMLKKGEEYETKCFGISSTDNQGNAVDPYCVWPREIDENGDEVASDIGPYCAVATKP